MWPPRVPGDGPLAWRGLQATHTPPAVRARAAFCLRCACPSCAHLPPLPHSDVSRNSEISLQCYLRSGDGPRAGGGAGGSGNTDTKDGQGDDVMGVSDIYLGGVKWVPDFDNHVRTSAAAAVGAAGARRTRKLTSFHSARQTSGTPSAAAQARSMCTSRIRAITSVPPRPSRALSTHTHLALQAPSSLTMDAFDLLKVIGKGSFGKVSWLRTFA